MHYERRPPVLLAVLWGAKIVYLKDVLLFPAKYTGNCDLSMPSVSKVRKARSQSSYKKRQEWSSSMLPSSYRNASVNAKETYMSLKEYKPGTTFPGVIGLTVDQSSPAWPEPMRAREGAPNVLFIVLDDTGYGQLGCYGSPIETPNLDSLAEGGLRYTNMHTTALCSPTRASSPGATTIPTLWPPSPSSPPAIPATTATFRSRTASFRRCC